MYTIYPMKLTPAYKDYLWGGSRLKSLYHKETPFSVVAESWEISCHEAGPSRIAEGALKGKTLKEVLEQKGTEWIGSRNPVPGSFPVLVKLIDAAAPLSVQVHPSDQNADALQGEQGKAEMWYVLEAQPGAAIYYGLKRMLTREEFVERSANGMICEDLNRVEVHPGESYYIMPGTIHALGEGILVAEVQQSSDTTFRIYDYKRLDTAGNPRPLHIQRASETANLTPVLPKEERSTSVIRFPGFCLTELFRCKYFRVTKLQLEDSILLDCDSESFHALLWTEGEALLEYKQDTYTLKKGESCFLPAGLGVYELKGQGEALLIRL